jgi:dTDP-4-dehydrorhamnose 3,5-epimerase-like enzyme
MSRLSPQTAKGPVGVQLRSLTMNKDNRGNLTEIFREEWDTGIKPIQWNVIYSNDAAAPSLNELLAQIEPWQPI